MMSYVMGELHEYTSRVTWICSRVGRGGVAALNMIPPRDEGL